jgi:hypothetical protein
MCIKYIGRGKVVVMTRRGVGASRSVVPFIPNLIVR